MIGGGGLGLGIGLPLSDERASEGPLGVRRGKKKSNLGSGSMDLARVHAVLRGKGGDWAVLYRRVTDLCFQPGNTSPVRGGQSISVCLSVCGAEVVGERWVVDEQTFGFHFVVFSPTVELVRVCTFVLRVCDFRVSSFRRSSR